MSFDFLETLKWCDETVDLVKVMQDACLDHGLDKETREILRDLCKVRTQLDELMSECEAKLGWEK